MRYTMDKTAFGYICRILHCTQLNCLLILAAPSYPCPISLFKSKPNFSYSSKIILIKFSSVKDHILVKNIKSLYGADYFDPHNGQTWIFAQYQIHLKFRHKKLKST